MAKKIKYTLKLISVDRVSYGATGEILEVHYQIFKKGQKKAVWGQKEGKPIDTTKQEIKEMLKRALATYTQEHQPVPEEEKKRLADRAKSDKLIKEMEGYEL